MIRFIERNGIQFVIDNVQAIKCEQCGEIYYTPDASRYIDEQIKFQG
ncbi:YgiT-type zinc finger protein [Paenibacillus albidus]